MLATFWRDWNIEIQMCFIPNQLDVNEKPPHKGPKAHEEVENHVAYLLCFWFEEPGPVAKTISKHRGVAAAFIILCRYLIHFKATTTHEPPKPKILEVCFRFR